MVFEDVPSSPFKVHRIIFSNQVLFWGAHAESPPFLNAVWNPAVLQPTNEYLKCIDDIMGKK